MNVVYKCRCFDNEVHVVVPDRAEDQDVVAWMHELQLAITRDHAERAPLCQNGKMEYVKIPLPKPGGALGEKQELQS